MAIKHYTSFSAEVESFPLRQAMVGILKPGRYAGFDTLTSPGDNFTVRVSHAGFIRKIDKDNNLETAHGVFMLPNGQIFHEDSYVEITLPTGLNSTSNIIALVVAQNYQEITGGNDPTYSLINEWSPKDYTGVRAVADNEIVLGRFEVEPPFTDNDFSLVKYYPDASVFSRPDKYVVNFNESQSVFINNNSLNSSLILGDTISSGSSNLLIVFDTLFGALEYPFSFKVVQTLQDTEPEGSRFIEFEVEASQSSNITILTPPGKQARTNGRGSVVEVFLIDPVNNIWLLSGDLADV